MKEENSHLKDFHNGILGHIVWLKVLGTQINIDPSLSAFIRTNEGKIEFQAPLYPNMKFTMTKRHPWKSRWS